jgi:hypothetical protein
LQRLKALPERRTGLVVARDWAFMLALVLPFVGQAFPYGVPLFLPSVLVTLMISLLLACWRDGLRNVSVGRGPFGVLMLVGIAFFLYGLLLTRQWDESLRSEITNAVAVMLLWLAVATFQWTSERLDRLEKRLIDWVALVAASIAVVGLIKFMLLLQGRKLAFIADASSGAYPWGTSLTSDYNMFALTMLAGLLAAMAWLVESRAHLVRLIAAGIIVLVCAAGFLSGSRRFWVVAPVSMLMLLVGYARHGGLRRVGSGVLLLVMCAALAGSLAYAFIDFDWQQVAMTGWDLQARLASVLDEEGGLDSRVRRWDFAFSMLGDWRVWTGNGFDYLQLFGCEFGDCRSASYPHNPLISALLYAGVPGMAAMLCLFLYMAWCGLHLLLRRPARPFCGALLLAHLPVTFISSNGLFAVKSLLVISLLGALCMGEAGRAARRGGAEQAPASSRDAVVTSASH